uniref:Transmembrane protein n=1 Tax=Knipowitschia caucasica TaxID=637954 RepID=A0AAV2LUH9_KNICA
MGGLGLFVEDRIVLVGVGGVWGWFVIKEKMVEEGWSRVVSWLVVRERVVDCWWGESGIGVVGVVWLGVWMGLCKLGWKMDGGVGGWCWWGSGSGGGIILYEMVWGRVVGVGM